MAELVPPPPNAEPLPAADVTVMKNAGNIEHEAFPVRKPEADLNDFKVQVRASTLARCRSRLREASTKQFPWYELALGISTLSAGSFLGALPAELPVGSPKAIFFVNVLPVVAASAFVAYLFLRHKAIVDAVNASNEVLTELPDPDKTR